MGGAHDITAGLPRIPDNRRLHHRHNHGHIKHKGGVALPPLDPVLASGWGCVTTPGAWLFPHWHSIIPTTSGHQDQHHGSCDDGARHMARPPTLSFDRGTLLLHPPPPGKAWIAYVTWDDRVERFRLPALHYRRLVEALRAEGTPLLDKVPAFGPLLGFAKPCPLRPII
jgi:hypothetical protein